MRTILLANLMFWFLSPALFSQKTIVLQPGPAEGKDAYINSAFPDDPGGPNVGLMACAWTFDGEFGIGRSLIRFDLSQIPPGTEILDARLTLYFDPDIAFGSQYGDNASFLDKVTEDWNENTVTWNSKPVSTEVGAVLIPETLIPTQDLVDIDITGFVSDWVNSPETNFGFVHRMATEIEYCCVVYSSSDNAQVSKRPKLVVTYRDCDPPIAGFSYSTQIPGVNFSDTSNSASSWFWDFGDGYFSNLQNPGHVYAVQGVYTVCLIVNDSCGADTTCKNVPVCEMPEPHYTYTSAGQMVSFHDSSTLPQSWFWDFGDGFYSDQQDPEHYFNELGTYYVCETVTNACSVETFCDSLTVISNSVAEYSPTSDVEIYPNPASDVVYLQLKSPVNHKVSIGLFNLQSVLLRTWITDITPAAGLVSLTLEGLSGGIYFLQTKMEGIIRLNKLIIL